MATILYIGNILNSDHKNPTYNNLLGGLLENEGFQLYYASSKNNKFLRLIEMLCACLKYRNQLDYVLIDTYSTLNFYYAFFVSQLCRILGLKFIPILHGGHLPKRLEKNPKMSKLIFKYAYRNIAPSKYLMEAFKSFDFKNVTYIPNTISIKEYPFKARTLKQVKLLWVRSFSKIYNPQLAVKVLKALQDEGISSTLCMVGPDSDGTLKQVESLANTLKVEVQFTGKLSKADWIKLSEAYTIFINTTNFDNTPLSVIEAMALGLPVVSTHVGGMPYLIDSGKDGLLVEPNKVEPFVNTIKSLLIDDILYSALAVNARHKVENFDWGVVKKEWIDVLN